MTWSGRASRQPDAAMRICLLPHPDKSVTGREAVLPLLAHELGCSPAELQIRQTEHGKPVLPDHPGFQFGISHSRGLLACCFHDRPCGIDLEWTGRPRDYRAIAAATFSPAELDLVSETADPGPLFYRMWTAKEAWLKYQGLRVWDIARAPDFDAVSPDLAQWLIEGSVSWIMSVVAPGIAGLELEPELPAGLAASRLG